MTNPTSNFGWQMPTSTDLVTDLPADFEVFGQAVDTDFVDLLGGTTGQVLSKTSNTDLDFTWVAANPGDITGVTAGTGISGGGTSGTVTVTNSMATEITAKGDLIVGTGSATFDNLAAGSNGETLVADSAATTGLRYSATPSASNPVINSAAQNWQRGTSFTITSPTYTADRWQAGRGANAAGLTVTRQVTSDTTNLPNIQYCIRSARDVSNTSTQSLYLAQSFETVNSIPFAGKTVTVSFYARAGANYSPTSNLLTLRFYTGTGTDQNVLTAGYTGSTATNTGFTLTTTWQRFTVSIAIASTATEIGYFFDAVPTGTAGANDYYEMTGMQIDIGSVALPFRTYAATIQGELAACQRYFYLVASGSGQLIANGIYISATQFSAVVPLPVTMRSAPTLSATSGTNYYATYNGASDLLNSLTIFSPGTTVSGVYNSSEAAGTQFRPAYVETNNAAAFVAFSAEL